MCKYSLSLFFPFGTTKIHDILLPGIPCSFSVSSLCSFHSVFLSLRSFCSVLLYCPPPFPFNPLFLTSVFLSFLFSCFLTLIFFTYLSLSLFSPFVLVITSLSLFLLYFFFLLSLSLSLSLSRFCLISLLFEFLPLISFPFPFFLPRLILLLSFLSLSV